MMDWHDVFGQPIPAACSFGLMGIINVSPDSFHEHCGGAAEAASRAATLLAEGADIIDIGAESTRPGAKPVSPAEECARLLPALKKIRETCPDAPVSVDTRNARTARLALENGCAIINDVSACRHDPELLEILAQFRPGYVLMHAKGQPETMQNCPEYDDAVCELLAFFEYWLKRLTNAGLPENRIALDPGVGFGKKLEHNLAILAHIGEFLRFGRPLLVGVSMKSMFGELQGSYDRGEATAVASALLFAKGVAWHRAHEIGRVRRALLLAQALQS